MPVKVRFVLSVIDATVPITTSPVVLITLPTLSSVKNEVPTPVTAVLVVLVVMVPVRLVFAHVAGELQLPPPVPLEITVAEKAKLEVAMNNKARPDDLRDCKIRFISDYHLGVKPKQIYFN